MKVADINEARLDTFVKTLESEESVEFIYNEFYYEIFESSGTGFMVNVYSDNEKDEDGDYLDKHLIDGGYCSGSARDAVEFML